MLPSTPVVPKQVERLATEAVLPSSPSESPQPTRSPSWTQTPSRSPSRSTTPGGGKAPKLRWTPSMLEVFLDALVLKVVEEGMRADSGFKREAWTYALEQVSKVNSSVTLDHCKSKITTCKEDWKLWSGLTRLSGFSATEHGVVVADNKVLQEYFDAHPKAKKFKSRPLEFEEQHRQLFEGVLATGQDALLIDNIITDDFEPAQSVERDPSVDTSQVTEEDSNIEQKPSCKRAGS